MQGRSYIQDMRQGLQDQLTVHVCLQCHFVRKSDMSSFMEDVSLIRPTELLMPPRITSMMHDRYQEMLAAKSAASPEQEQQQRQASLTCTQHALHEGWSDEMSRLACCSMEYGHLLLGSMSSLQGCSSCASLKQPAWACHSGWLLC